MAREWVSDVFRRLLPLKFITSSPYQFVMDYFEIDRLIEELAKLYSCSCATSWFKIENRMNPTRDEYRNKVVEFMNHFEYTLNTFPRSPEGEKFKKRARDLLHNESMLILKGNNKEVEKRYRYFVNSR